MKRLAVSLGVTLCVVMLGGRLMAGDEALGATKEKPKDLEAVLQDLTLTGKVEKTQKQGKEGQTIDVYSIAVPDGEPIHPPWHKKEGSSLMNLEDYVGKVVKIAAKGMVTEKDGKKKTIIKKIISIEAAGDGTENAPPPPPPPPK